jgi:site-specific recombinase XerD
MRTEHDELEQSEPRSAQQLYLKHKETECVESTVRAHKYRTNQFVQWCNKNDVHNMNDLTGRDLQAYRLWRQDEGDLKKITLNQQMSTIRVFLKWCGSIEAVPANLYEKVMVPRVRPEHERREETLDAEAAQTVLDYLTTYHYASDEHAIFALLWETGIRLGAANSLDVEDLDPDEKRIDLEHRPDRGTQLKNAGEGERPVALSENLASMLQDYVENGRHEISDEHGREPLFTTTHGRMHRTTIRGVVYRVTAPCFRGEPCPGCTETDDRKCPGAVSPHAIRRGSITHYLSEDVPVEVIGDRMNVSRDVLDKHYDKRSEDVKLEQRRGYLENV